jgi:[ribosomal protein S18]-alanine N-acetyltransferase
MRHARISRFRLADLKGVVAIESAAFRGDAFPAEAFFELHQTCPECFLVAKSNGSVVGYIGSLLQGSDAEIVSIAVDPRHRRQGIGRALMMHTFAKLKGLGIQRVTLTVRPRNRPAIRLYSALGFRSVRRMSHYYADGSDAFEMRRILSLATRAADASISSATST